MTSTIQSLNEENLRMKWMSLIKDCRSSGLTVKQWCIQEHIGVSTYYHWQKKIFNQTVAKSVTTRASDASLPQFAEIVIPQVGDDTHKEASATAKLTIGRTTIELFQPLTSSMLRVLLQEATHA